jgi:hypothetical protein
MQRFVMVELPLPHFGVNTDVETDDRIQQAPHVQLGSCSVLLAPIASCAARVHESRTGASKSKWSILSALPTPSHRTRIFTYAMPPKKRDRSPSGTPVPSTEVAQNDGSHLTQAQWGGMQKVLNHIYDYRTEE